ncbi:von Willebrand factor type A domain protein [Phycisphaerae bacterium RAS1]|nr:von Willebrand factor type A domain protein [Phycisphaerae bacterium RAS1]
MIVFLVIIGFVVFGRMNRGSRNSGGGQGGAPAAGRNAIDLPSVDQRLCTAVAIVVDTSGSMSQTVRDDAGRKRAKHEIAREALQGIIAYTAEWKKQHAERKLELGIFGFSSGVAPILPMGEFDADRATAAIAGYPPPGGGTAIGRALETGAKSIYGTGCVRKFIVCITDGENTSGPKPERVAQQLFTQTGGEVELQFIAFDIEAKRFSFLSAVNGHVTEASDGPQLQARLSEIYEKRILAESEAEKP